MTVQYREQFDTPAAFLTAAVQAATGGAEDPRLERMAAATGANEGVPSAGGFAVPEQFAESLWQTVYSTGQLLTLCTGQPITVGNELTLPAIDETSRADGSRFGGVTMTWVDEADTVTASRPKYRSIKLQPKKLLGLSYATDELASDAVALAAWLERTFGLEAAFEIEDAIINGTGAGRPLGVLNSGALITVDKESGQVASTVQAANFTNMMQRLWGPSRRSAVWLTNTDVMAQAEGLSLSNGAPLVTYDAEGNPRILGRPALLTEYSAALGTAGDVILADFSQYLVGEIAPQFLSSIHLRFIYDERVFRLRYRVDGAPAWSSPVTPKNSSTTQSPFVALAERS